MTSSLQAKAVAVAARWAGMTVLALVLLIGAVAPVQAQNRTPRLLDGKTSLYERVLTRPGAAIVAQPGQQGGSPVPPLSQYYVYDRKAVGGGDWIEVGAGSRGKTDGWIAADATLPWKQQMALAFTNPAGRDRTLLFDKRETVVELLKAPDSAAAVAPIQKAVEQGKGDPRVVSIEPATYIDIDKQFYLLPILQAGEEESGKGFRARVIEIASVTAKADAASPATAGQVAPQAPQPPPTEAIKAFSAAVVFVIDSTISMGPYIDRTREAVRRVYDAVEKAGLGRQVKFGLVAFRSSTKAVPKLEYVTKTYVDPNTVTSGGDFLDKVASLKEATVSSARFDEDPYAGVMAAVKGIDWDAFGGRYVVLITDAGAIEGHDPLSGTGLDAQQVRLELQERGIALYALHLKTGAGKADHAHAAAQYKELSRNPNAPSPLYFPVDAGSVEQFGQLVDQLAGQITGQVKAASKGDMVPGSARTATATAPAAAPAASPTPEQAKAQMAAATDQVGRAMQLAWLGRTQGTAAPPLFHAWLSDRAFAQPDKATTEVRVLLTKNQLSDIAEVVSTVLDAGEKSQQTATADFFDLIRSAAAHLARDPGKLADPNATRLGQLGLLGEYLDDLPYKSDVMGLTRDEWVSWSTSEQEELLDKLRRKLRLYQLYNDDSGRWVALAPGADAGDRVYPVPLEALP
ncbi:MAG: vWA domain-containing protein [Rhodospirillales bacterium]